MEATTTTASTGARGEAVYELRVPPLRVPRGLLLEEFVVQEQGSHPRASRHGPDDLEGAVRSLAGLGVSRSVMVAVATGPGGLEYTCPFDAVAGRWEEWE